MIIININCTTRIGYIYNATYISTNITTIITYTNTCSECICFGFFSNVPPLYVGLNCYKNNKTCALFTNYSSSSIIKTDVNSTFIFIQQPPSSNTITASTTSSTTALIIASESTSSTISTRMSTTTVPCINRFPTQVTYSTGSGSGPYPVTTGDVNADGKPDIIVTNYKAGTLGIFLNTGNGTFLAQVTYPTGATYDTWSVTVSDVNRDGKLDIIVGHTTLNSLGIFLNTGTGIFGAQVTYSTGTNSKPYSVVTADVNGDSKPDIIVANYGTNKVGVLLNLGNGTFGPQVAYSVGTTPFSVAAADVNGDGKYDIIVANTGVDNVGVLFNTGNGTFGAQVTYSTGSGSQPYSVVTSDVNGDNKLDIIVANYNTLNVGVFLNTGIGTFFPQVTYSTGSNSYPYYVVVGDVNGDGYPDIIAANYYADNVGVFLNTGNGTFVAQVTYSTGTGSAPYSVGVADVNGDNTLDIIVGNYNADNVGVFLSNCN